MTLIRRKVLVTGGGGYVGASLVPELLANDFDVSVIDLMIYGEDVLPAHKHLTVHRGDIRDQKLLREVIPGHDAVIHLACISNDPSFELNPILGKSINLDAFSPLVEISRASGVERFLYASSSSVYGIKEEPDVDEDMTLEPLTDYSRYKAQCESMLFDCTTADFVTVAIRPATVCGYSRRQRLDVVVNILTNIGYHKREITVFGGTQLRPNIHIEDMVRSYMVFLEADPGLISGQCFNVGYENQSVQELAETVREVLGDDIALQTIPTNDNRSYHISSRKISQVLGFAPAKTIRDAVQDLHVALKSGLLPDSLSDEKYFNIKKMQAINLS